MPASRFLIICVLLSAFSLSLAGNESLAQSTQAQVQSQAQAKSILATQNDICGGLANIKGETGLFGPKGDVGPRGKKGPRGDVGPMGPRGPNGPQGPQGEMGDVGEAGDRGPTGKQGPMGIMGIAGKQGKLGLKGLVGDIGPRGDKGPRGPKGPRGDKGDKGDKGPRGPKGIKGKKGLKGLKGIQGIQGIRGMQGAQGAKGPEGQLGIRGVRGYKGLKGDKGAQGAQGMKGDRGPDALCEHCSYGRPDCFEDMVLISDNRTPLLCPAGYYAAGFSLAQETDSSAFETKSHQEDQIMQLKHQQASKVTQAKTAAQEKAGDSSDRFIWKVENVIEWNVRFKVTCCAFHVEGTQPDALYWGQQAPPKVSKLSTAQLEEPLESQQFQWGQQKA